jgi:DNA-binding NarL/FixJ family response regulator
VTADAAIRVVLADDHPIVREGLRGMLAAEPGIEVVAEAASGAEAVAVAARYRPDVVLMDLRMPGGDGVTATAEILAATPGARVVVLTTYETDADIVRAVEAGAVGYLLKDTPVAELGHAIRAAARGETVLALVARGLTNAEIGHQLSITQATVKTHLIRSFSKLGVNDRTAAVTSAIALGAIAAPGR